MDSKKVQSTIAILVIGAIFAVSAIVPVSFLENLPLCHLKALFGFKCPGCGLTRAFFLFFHGEFRQSVASNALAPVVILWLLLYGAQHLSVITRGYPPRWFTKKGNKLIASTFLILFFGQWIWKSGQTLWMKLG